MCARHIRSPRTFFRTALRLARQRLLKNPRQKYRAICRYFSIGARGERIAARYLGRNFYHIWDMNVRLRGGEIDIVAAKNRTLVFVEVKTRSKRSAAFARGLDAVDEEKQRRIKSLAAKYMKDNRALLRHRRIRAHRFDVIEVVRERGVFGFRVRQFEGSFG